MISKLNHQMRVLFLRKLFHRVC
uniref:Uncharacterized protein n=1 Tax=Solanum lycopersicum TaxID=4081 RepID=A0A3Q7EVZ5_SOLLC